MRVLLLILVVAAAACHEVVELPAPDLLGATSALVVYGSGDTVLGVEAIDVAGGQRFAAFSRNDDLTTEVMVLSYACPLSVLGLVAGRQELRAVPNAGASVPTGVRLQRLDLRGPTGSTKPEWRDDDPADPVALAALARMPLPPGGTCALFGAQITQETLDIDVGPTGDASAVDAAVSLGDGQALVLTSSGGQQRAWLVSSTGVVASTTLTYRDVATSSVPPGALTRDARGTLWHVSDRGAVARGTLARGLEVVGRVTASGAIRSVIAADDTSLEEPTLFIVAARQFGHAVIEYPSDRIVAESDVFGLPTVFVNSRDDLTIVALDIADLNILHAWRTADGTWMTAVEPLPAPVPEAGRSTEVASAGVRLREGRTVAVTSLYEQRGFLPVVKGTYVVTRSTRGWQRAAHGYQPDRVTLLATDLGGGLLALTSVSDLFRITGGTIDLYQLDAGSCGELRVSAQRQPDRMGIDLRKIARVVALDPTTTLVVTAGVPRSVLLRRSRPGPSCLGAPLRTP
jgi:hypothetical protein